MNRRGMFAWIAGVLGLAGGAAAATIAEKKAKPVPACDDWQVQQLPFPVRVRQLIAFQDRLYAIDFDGRLYEIVKGWIPGTYSAYEKDGAIWWASKGLRS